MTSIPSPRIVHRALGLDSARERIGIGFMDKSGIRHDQTDFDPPTWSLVFVLHGRGRLRDDRGRWSELTAGDAFVRIPGRPNTTELDPTSRWREAFIDLGASLPQVLTHLRMLPERAHAWRCPLDAEQLNELATIQEQLAQADERALANLCLTCQRLVLDALARLDPAHTPGEDAIDRCCRLLADEAATRLVLRSFCRRENLDFERFRKEFRQRVGQSPGQYRIRRRIERACALLHSSNDDLSSIAHALGYSSAYEFSTQFRQWMGVPPGRYRDGSSLVQ